MTNLDKLQLIATILAILGWSLYIISRLTGYGDIQILPRTN